MKISKLLNLGVLGIAVVTIFAALPDELSSQQSAAVRVIPIDGDDIGGVVTSDKGPEAGVWVIAETSDLPTKLAKIVVTDDQGRYVIPDLPRANYNIWVRGYGLIDSAKVRSTPGKNSQPKSGHRAERGRGGAILSGDILVFHAQDSRQERVSGHGRQGQRDA